LRGTSPGSLFSAALSHHSEVLICRSNAARF
jgi:hypothetical protein